MKKIKSFFLRNYQCLIRFFILFSAVACVAFSGLTASATEVYNFVFSKPEITSNSCVVEIVTANGWKMCIYVSAYSGLTSTGGFSTTFKADVLNNELRIYSVKSTTENSAGNSVPIFNRGYYMECNWNTTGTLAFDGQSPARLSLANSGSVTAIHGYNCDVSSVSNNGDFVFSYGSDPVFQNQLNAINSTIESFKGQNQEQLNQILQAIIDNKSSAEKNEYATPDTSNTTQYEQQESAVLDSTAAGRTSAVDTMSGLGGLLDNHIGKSLLAMSKLLSEFIDLDWINDIVHFSLVVGLFTFVLGISSIVIMKGLSMRSADRKADTTNLHRPRLPK